MGVGIFCELCGVMKFIRYLFPAILEVFSIGCGGVESREEVSAVEVVCDTTFQADSLSFAFVGDVMMGTTWPDSVGGSHLPENGGRGLFAACKEIFGRVDVTCGNLEGCFLDGSGHPRRMTNPNTYFLFRMPEGYVENLVDAGFDFVGIANNHINDFGAEGRERTMSTLRRSGLGFAGLRDSCEVAWLDRGGVRIGLTQFGHGDNNLDVNDLGELRRVVEGMRDSADVVVVSFHGGAEGADCVHVPHGPEFYVGERRGDVEAFAHAAVDAGADIVVGHGPHVPRGVELYKGRVIFYSLGNFCTPYRLRLTGVCGLAPVVEVTLNADGSFRHGRIHSFEQFRGVGPRRDVKNRAAQLMGGLSREDFPQSPLRVRSDGRLEVEISSEGEECGGLHQAL